jgi:hypothetical protein
MDNKDKEKFLVENDWRKSYFLNAWVPVSNLKLLSGILSVGAYTLDEAYTKACKDLKGRKSGQV